MRHIKIAIDKAGQASVEVSCVVGASCEELTQGIEQKLGKVLSRSRKEDFFQSADVGANQGQ